LSQGYALLTSLFLAVALGATSMGISVRSFMAVDEIDSRAGKTVIGSLVLNDITGLILLTGVVGYAGIVTGGSGSLWIELAKVLISVIIFFIIFFIGFVYLPRLTNLFMHLKVEEAQFSLAVIIILISAWAASNFGLSAIIGAFFCGIVLSKSPVFENHTFVQKISSLSYGFFIPIFFAYTGAQLSFNNLGVNLLRALKFLGIVTLIQVGCGFVGAKINRYSLKESLLVGIGMLPYGEVTLVVMSSLVAFASAYPSFFVGNDIAGIFSSMLLLILMSIILTPTLMIIVVRSFKTKRKKNVRAI
jgi:Kef-type K+ transport system membrane component KefB